MPIMALDFQNKDLHSNMVRFIIYKYRMCNLIKEDLHSNMVRFIM